MQLWSADGQPVQREVVQYHEGAEAADKGAFRHFMLKEIHEQPRVVQRTLEGRLGAQRVLVENFGPDAAALFAKVRNVQIVACGTSYHAGLVARYWIEELTGIPCQVEVASEFRYRKVAVQPDALFVTISQSGETADTLAALRTAKQLGFLSSLAICNVATSSLVRESDMTLLTLAGPEIGVASTKAFTTQLVALLLLTLAIGQVQDRLEEGVRGRAGGSPAPPAHPPGRGAGDGQGGGEGRRAVRREEPHPVPWPWHPVPGGDGRCAEAEGNLLHPRRGLPRPASSSTAPLALVDADMPVVTVAPNNELLEKLKSNLQEVRARGGELIVFAEAGSGLGNGPGTRVVSMPPIHDCLAPILYTVPLQLLSYHVAVLKGTDVDQPRNLAKSVTSGVIGECACSPQCF